LEKDLDQWETRQQAFLRRAEGIIASYQDRVILCGVTALQVLGVQLPSQIADWKTYHLAVRHKTIWPERRDVKPHCSQAPAIWRTIAGLPLLHPVDCWLQLTGASDNDLIEVGDGLIRRRDPILELDALNRRLIALKGRRNVKRVRDLTQWLEPGTDSIYETRTRLALLRAGLPCPTVNCEVFCPRANRLYHLDMGYREEKVGIEYDGTVHVGDRRQMEIDAIRRRHLQDEGWMIITVTASQLEQAGEFLRSVESALVMRRAARANAW